MLKTPQERQSLNILKQNDLNAQIFFFWVLFISVFQKVVL